MWMESKQGCCASASSPTSGTIGNHAEGGRYSSAITSSPVEWCGLRKCKYAKSHIHYSLCNTQRLLNKIQYLKRSIQDLETAQRQISPEILGKKNVLSQTQDLSHAELGNVQEVVNKCIMEMTRLKKFLDDENCWWELFKQREFTCCEQKLPHLHGFLDGTMVTLKMIEEQQCRTSTPLKSKSLTSLDCKSLSQKRLYTELDMDKGEEIPKSYRDCSINTTRSIESDYVKTLKPCPEHCPRPCKMHRLSSLGTPREDSKIDQIDDLDDQNGSMEDKDKKTPERVSEDVPEETPGTKSEKEPGTTRPRSLAPLPGDTWFTKSALDVSKDERPSITFGSENMAKKAIIQADISTSMDLLPDMPYKKMRPSEDIRSIIEKSLPLTQRRSASRNSKPRIKKQIQQMATDGAR